MAKEGETFFFYLPTCLVYLSTRKQNNTTIPDILSVIYRGCRGLLYLYFPNDANQYLPTAKYLA